MKKLLLIGVLLATLVIPSFAQNYVSRPFLTGWSLLVTTNVTINYGDTNVLYASAANTNLLASLTNSEVLAVFTSVTATNTLAANMGNGSGWWSNGISASLTNVLWAQAWGDVAVPADRNGKVSDNVALTVVFRGTNSLSTNRTTFTFAGVASGGRHIKQGTQILPSPGILPGFPNVVFTETAGPSFVVGAPANGLTPVVIHTNVSSAFLQGLGALRLSKIVTDATLGTTTSTFVDDVSLEGFQP